MKIRIPVVVTDKGTVSSCFFRNKDGKEVQDVGLLTDGVPEGQVYRLVHVEADLDMPALFAHMKIEGQVVE